MQKVNGKNYAKSKWEEKKKRREYYSSSLSMRYYIEF